ALNFYPLNERRGRTPPRLHTRCSFPSTERQSYPQRAENRKIFKACPVAFFSTAIGLSSCISTHLQSLWLRSPDAHVASAASHCTVDPVRQNCYKSRCLIGLCSV